MSLSLSFGFFCHSRLKNKPKDAAVSIQHSYPPKLSIMFLKKGMFTDILQTRKAICSFSSYIFPTRLIPRLFIPDGSLRGKINAGQKHVAGARSSLIRPDKTGRYLSQYKAAAGPQFTCAVIPIRLYGFICPCVTVLAVFRCTGSSFM